MLRIVPGVMLAAWIGLICLGVAPAASGQDRNTENVLGLPQRAFTAGGKLVICGGGELPESVYEDFIEAAGGSKARLVLIPTAYPFDNPGHYKRYYGGWNDYDVASFDFLDTSSRKIADTDKFCRVLDRATGVWIGGGAQGRLTDIYGGTKVEAALKRVLERGGVIGGTSAGASVMSKCMIRSGPHTEAELCDGLGFLERVVIDQHFSERGRHTRLLGVMKEHPEQLAIGLDEGAAVMVTGSRVRVLGDADVTIGATRENGRLTMLYHMQAGEEADVVQIPGQGKPGELALTLTARESSKK
jgi:cyanophycinase